MNKIGSYVNGNTMVIIYDDGTKERYIKDSEKPYAEFPESIDLKITNYCDMGCLMCAESSGKDGKHADLFNNKLFDYMNPYTELAIGGGNPLAHPELIPFLGVMKRRNIICNLTVNINHFMMDHYQYTLRLLQDIGYIHGLGISVTDGVPYEFYENVKYFPNAVVHTIAGVTPITAYMELAGHDLNLLILGYKTKGRGIEYGNRFPDVMSERFKNLESFLCDTLSTNSFRAIAFDNCAVDQFRLKEKLEPELYEKLYMGNDGEFTMFIDLVKRMYGKSSAFSLRKIDANNINDLFHNVQKIEEA